MAHEPKGLFRLGGISLVVSGALFLLKIPLDLAAGSPPSSGKEILAWMASGKLPLALVNEVVFIAGMFLVPGVIALYVSLANTDRNEAAIGSGLFAVAIPVLFAVAIVHGRLVYDVYGIHVDDPGVAELVVAVYYGGLHAIGIMLAVATLVLSLAMKRGIYGRNIAYLGFATCVFDLVGSYPWSIGTTLVVVSQALFAAWFIAVGLKLCSLEPASATRAS